MDWSKMDKNVSDILDSALGDDVGSPHDDFQNASAFAPFDLQYPSPGDTGTSIGASASNPSPPVPGARIAGDLFSAFPGFSPENALPPVNVNVPVPSAAAVQPHTIAQSAAVAVAQPSKKRSREDPPTYATEILKRRDEELSGEKLNKRRISISEANKKLAAASSSKGGGSTSDAKRKVRAERNRVSAMKSRERIGKKEEDLEKRVFNGRVENKTLKRGILKFRRYLNCVINESENKYGAEHSRKVLPKTYRVRDMVEKTIKDCVWTFRPEDTPLVQLKYKKEDDEGHDEGQGTQHS